MGLFVRIEDAAIDWLDRRKQDRKMRRYGGIQKCPWCHEWFQYHEGSKSEVYEPQPFLDKYTCGNCGGTSLWHFALGMIFVAPLNEPPRPDDGEWAKDFGVQRGSNG